MEPKRVKSDSDLALLLHSSGLFQRILSAGLYSFKHCPRGRATLMHSFSPKLRVLLPVRGVAAAVAAPRQSTLHITACLSLTLSTGRRLGAEHFGTAIRYPTSTPGLDTPLYHRMLPQKSPSSQTRQFSTSTSTPASTNTSALQVTCQCTSISFSLPYAHLQAIYHCHCSQCRKQSASAFGTSAIFPASDVFPLSPTLHEKLQCWTRPTKEGRKMDCYFCKECGVRVMHRIIEADGKPRTTVSVKGGVIEGLAPDDWKGAKHIYVESAVVEVPEAVERWEGAPGLMEGRPWPEKMTRAGMWLGRGDGKEMEDGGK